jgi:hypothetical protein
MQTEPQIGKIYASQTDPKLVVYVVDVTSVEGDEGFTVEACDPAYKDDIENADGMEITADIWAQHGFTPVSE